MISYPWATALVYRAYGEAPPAPAGAAAARGGGPASDGTRRSASSQRGVAAMHGARACRRSTTMIVAKAATQMPDWKTISVALPAAERAARRADARFR